MTRERRQHNPKPAPTVLLVDDDPTSRTLTSGLLQGMGYRVYQATDGDEAVQIGASQTCDIILMDLQMPRLGGIEATGILRASGLPTPILALSATVDPMIRRSCLEAGMNDCLRKPVLLEELRKALSQHLQPHRQDAASPMTAPSPAATGPESADALAYHHSLTILAKDFGIPRSQIMTVLQMFFQETSRRLEMLEDAVGANDAGSARELAHTIKGGASYLRLAQVARRAASLEDAAKGGRHQSLHTELARLRAAFQEALTWI